jgi:hypothetical protein
MKKELETLKGKLQDIKEEEARVNLNNVKLFFDYDIRIKNMIVSLIPNKELYDKEEQVSYLDNLYKGLKDIEYYILKINKLLKLDELNEDINEFFDNLKADLDATGYRYRRVISFYEAFITDMHSSFVRKVNESIYGYSDIKIKDVFNEITTVNELIHFYHMYIINNENIYRNTPVLEEKKYDNNNKVVLCGDNNIKAKEIFDNILNDKNYGDTYILSLDNKIIIMVSGLGHALTIEIDNLSGLQNDYDFKSLKNDKFIINYFIPKVYDVDKIKELKGLNHYKEIDTFARGVFDVDGINLAKSISDFLENVPTKEDIVSNYKR